MVPPASISSKALKVRAGALLCLGLVSALWSLPVHAAEFGARGGVHYLNYGWDTDPDRRDAVDLNKLTVEFWADLSESIQIEAEVEIEHGGTGATMEFDRLEEFGEFEQEIEAGGEVIVEELIITAELSPRVSVQFGHLLVPVGLYTLRHEPEHYFTATVPQVEAHLIPTTWHETGIEIAGSHRDFHYRAQVVNGLDSTAFSSANWIARGHQQRFETANAEDLAVVGRLDWGNPLTTSFGVSAYYGDTANNRPKPDTTLDAHVTIVDVHAVYEEGPVKARALLMYGSLENATQISRLNRNLSNNLNVKRTPVGSAALGWYVEAGYDLSSLAGVLDNRLDIFGRYEFYDTMFRVDEDVFDNPRWRRKAWTAGLNYALARDLILKTHYTSQTLGLEKDNKENTFALGFGFSI